MDSLTREQYSVARLSRDPRFDGVFFVAVKTTGIFCRPICPANLPREENVEYFSTAPVALQAGYRPCLRCRPDSAPNSWAWLGKETSFRRAVKLIEQGALQYSNLETLSDRLGVTSRYLRQLFQNHLGMSPKVYAQYHQLMFAKQLLHSSSLSITDVCFASGFNSTRRFNDAFKKYLKLTPSQMRRHHVRSDDLERNVIHLAYRGQYHWESLLDFNRLRAIEGVEDVTPHSYSRYVDIDGSLAWFKLYADVKGKQTVKVEFELEDVTKLSWLMSNIKRVFDLNTDVALIEERLSAHDEQLVLRPGLRLPGVWSTWEAGVRAVVGQQVSVKAAVGQLNLLTDTLGHNVSGQRVFPNANVVARSDLSFLKMPNSRKETLARLAQHIANTPESPPSNWLSLKGIGPWTVSYARMRGASEPDLFLDSDLIVKKYLAKHPQLNAAKVSPWGSYATLHCWSHFS
ncbi:Bifunctional transcriptional activator/DNA repair enzyme Ada [Vibrio thalassae]|uniref:Bifunctional transcriptional activator/DNA repair enzyme Ada n=1 Tax=Vibrio thalassae TaxID=1243014 RepID=A0A240EHI6_9VIBR|nr:Ada metal-binding domain-containing protein [Vibrio thalassae]SNX48167.1 Bifunctional transcriptional activator/DNA repair enzyme Ada [Vibrio thalassae]